MKLILVFILSLVFLFGCQFSNQESETIGLQIVDISRVYPKKEILLQNIAEIEYISLETTDDVLLGSMNILSYVSDRYILIWEIGRYNIFIFNRNGKILTHFNHRGNGDDEYLGITDVIFDEEGEEIFVLSMSTHRIWVYSVNGEYRRTLKYSNDLSLTSVYNFDNETLLVYNNYRPYYNITCEKPYMFMSKKDGSIVSRLDINVPIRYSNRVVQEIDFGGGKKGFTPLVISIPNNRHYGQNFVIADISLDTIYLLSLNRNLTPLLGRTPSVHLSEPRTVWTSLLTTDKFIILHKVTLDFETAEKGQSVSTVNLLYDFKTREISDISFVDADFAMRKWMPPGTLGPDIPKNMDAELISVSRLKTAHEEKKLKGELEKLVATLDENDNPVIRVIKFK